jgi:hypothetical protein
MHNVWTGHELTQTQNVREFFIASPPPLFVDHPPRPDKPTAEAEE